MRVLVTVPANQDSEAGVMPDKESLEEMGKFNEQLVRAGVMLAGEGLHPSSRAKRVRFGGGTAEVLDGPFADAAVAMAGFWIWEVASMDEAVSWIRRSPFMKGGETIEIRPILEADDFGEAMTPELRASEDRMRRRLSDRRAKAPPPPSRAQTAKR